jgi:hypothetical protein
VLFTPVTNLPPVSLILVAQLPLVSTTLAKLVEKRWQFSADIIDTGGKLSTRINIISETSGKICRRRAKNMHIILNYTLKKNFCQNNFAAGDGAVSRDQEAVQPSAT